MPMINPNGKLPGEIEAAKKEYAKRHHLSRVPSTADLIKLGVKGIKKSLVRSASGVTVIAVMIRPESCPYDCAYCPTSSIAAKSYTGFEPAARRARQNNYDAGRQVAARIDALEATGHATEKCELVVMGGTFNVQPERYQEEFLKSALEAFNGKAAATVKEALENNETAKHRVIGITFETRPDCATQKQVSKLVDYGATRIELGAQSIYDDALAKVNRGHTTAQTAQATANCKNALLKVGYHIMPGLYSTPEKDEEMARQLFNDQRYCPDMLKIYPTLVIPGTQLHERWLKGEFKPYTTAEAAATIAAMMRHVPKYCRIMRVDRDIPTDRIAAGVDKSNIRQLVEEEMARNGWACNDIRSREIGLKRNAEIGAAELNELRYAASGGDEVFISLDTKNGDLVGYLRLRRGNQTTRPEIDGNTAGIRELRVLGEALALGSQGPASAQHKSFGGRLLQRAEEIAKEWGSEKMTVIAGAGARPYYYKKGFAPDGAYLSKKAPSK